MVAPIDKICFIDMEFYSNIEIEPLFLALVEIEKVVDPSHLLGFQIKES